METPAGVRRMDVGADSLLRDDDGAAASSGVKEPWRTSTKGVPNLSGAAGAKQRFSCSWGMNVRSRVGWVRTR